MPLLSWHYPKVGNTLQTQFVVNVFLCRSCWWNNLTYTLTYVTPLGTYIPFFKCHQIWLHFNQISGSGADKCHAELGGLLTCPSRSHQQQKSEIMITDFRHRPLSSDLELCLGDSGAPYQLMMTVNLHLEGLESVIKYVHICPWISS